jgi:hypothetical protein
MDESQKNIVEKKKPENKGQVWQFNSRVEEN